MYSISKRTITLCQSGFYILKKIVHARIACCSKFICMSLRITLSELCYMAGQTATEAVQKPILMWQLFMAVLSIFLLSMALKSGLSYNSDQQNCYHRTSACAITDKSSQIAWSNATSRDGSGLQRFGAAQRAGIMLFWSSFGAVKGEF